MRREGFMIILSRSYLAMIRSIFARAGLEVEEEARIGDEGLFAAAHWAVDVLALVDGAAAVVVETVRVFEHALAGWAVAISVFLATMIVKA